MAITAQKLLPSSRGGALSKVSRSIVKESSSITITDSIQKDVKIIRTSFIEIDNILKGTLASEKKALDSKKRQDSSKRREKQEEKLETKPQAERGPIKMPKIPRMGFLDWVKNFIGNVILGYFAVRLVDYLPKIMPIVKFLGSAADFILDTGGKLLNGLVTFIDWGYKAIDFTKGMMKSIGGENFAKVFDGFTGAVGTLVETAIIAATVIASQGEGGLLDTGTDLLRDRLLGKGAQQAAQTAAGQVGGTAAKAGSIGAATVAAVVAGAGLLSSALGEGAFQVRKVAVKPIQNLEKAYKEDKNPLTKIGRGIALTMVRPLYGLFSTVGFLLDVVGAPFRYAMELLRYPFLSEEDKVKQANNLAKFDARIREDLRKAMNMLTLGFAFKEKGSFGNIYGNKGSQKEMMSKMQGGGITRGGKTQTGAKRTIGKGKIGKYKRSIPRKPGEVEIKPGADVGGEDKIFGIFPNPFKKVVDTFNPFKPTMDAGKNLGKTDYFGPILAITSKITLGQKPSQRDYENVGLGINMLISKGIQENQLKGGLIAAFAEGGLVDPDVLSAAETGGDISNWVARTFQGEIESNAQKTLRLIRENAAKKSLGKDIEKDAPSGEDMGLGAGVQVSSDSEDFWLLATAAMFENSNPQGSADVAQVIYNRTQYSAWNAPTIRKAILNPGQFQPVRQYGGTAAWASIKNKEDALRFSKSHGKTQEQLERVAAALLDKSKQSDARSFVGPRDSFRAEAYEKANNHLANETEKTRHGHTFGFEPGGAMIGQFKSGKLSAAQVNANVVGNVNLKGGDGSFIQGNSGRSEGTHFHIGTTKPGDASGVAAAGFNTIKHFLGKKSIFVGRSGETIPAKATDEQIRGYIGRGQAAHRQTELDLQIGGTGAGNKVAFPLALKGIRYSNTDGYGVSADVAGVNAFVGHGRYKPDGSLAPQQKLVLNSGAPDFYAFHGENFGIVPKSGLTLKLHPGEMFKVIDKDSVDLLGFDLTKEIIDIENKSQLVAKAPSIIEKLKAISGYASYEEGSPQTIFIPSPAEENGEEDYLSQSSGGLAMLSSGESDDPFKTLYQGT